MTEPTAIRTPAAAGETASLRAAETQASPRAAAMPSPAALPPEQRERLAQVMQQHQTVVYAYLRARVAQPSDADDLLQEVFLRFQLAEARYDSNREVLPFVMGIARNLLRERARRLRRRNEITWTEICMEVEEPAREVEPDPHAEIMPHLADCLKTLSANAQMALELHYHRRIKLKAIGQRLGRTAGAVKLLMFRARQTLKKCLDGKRAAPSLPEGNPLGNNPHGGHGGKKVPR